MPTEPLRRAWAEDRPVLNAWCLLEGVSSAAALADAGFDTVTLDAQHGASAPDAAAAIFGAVEAAGSVPFVRLRWNHPAEVMRMLDVGARGLICPMVGSAAEAEQLVSAARYPPAGRRSYGPISGAFGAGPDHVARANEDVLVFAMIETAEGLARVDDIASVRGLDGLYVGPADLSLALGLETFGGLEDPTMLGALDRVLEAARGAGIVPGVHAPSTDRTIAMLDRGFRFVGAVVDADLLRSGAADALARLRA